MRKAMAAFLAVLMVLSLAACGGSGSMISRVIYTLVGLSAVWCVSLLFRDRDPVEERR